MNERDPELLRVLTDLRTTVDLCSHIQPEGRCLRDYGHDGDHELLQWGQTEPLALVGASRPAILLVDDDAAVLRSLERGLRAEAADWDLVFELGGSAGLARLAEQRFDVVVSDYRMPMVSGDVVLASAASLQPKAVRVILSASDVTADEVNAQVFIAKPFDPREVRTLLRRLVSR